MLAIIENKIYIAQHYHIYMYIYIFIIMLNSDLNIKANYIIEKERETKV